ncbi:hypothetical protein SGPA1_31215 [Streptomyces misionensis JCM 4497]
MAYGAPRPYATRPSSRHTDHWGTTHVRHRPRRARRRPPLSVHGRPQAPGRPARVPGRGAGRRCRHRAAARQGHGGRRGTGAPGGPRRRLRPPRQAGRGQRPGRRGARRPRRGAAPRAGRPAGPRGPRDPRRRRADRPLHARRGGGRRGRRPGRRGLLLHGPLLAHPDQARPPRPRPRPGPVRRRARHRPPLVRHRRHRPGQPGRGAGRRGPPGGRGPRAHRGRGPGRRGGRVRQAAAAGLSGPAAPFRAVRPKGWTANRQIGQFSPVWLGDRHRLANLRVWPSEPHPPGLIAHAPCARSSPAARRRTRSSSRRRRPPRASETCGARCAGSRRSRPTSSP